MRAFIVVLVMALVLSAVSVEAGGVFAYVAEEPYDVVLAFESGKISSGSIVVVGGYPSSIDPGDADQVDARFVFDGQFGSRVVFLVDRRKAGDALADTGAGHIVFIGRVLTAKVKHSGGRFDSDIVVRAIGTLDR